MTVDAVGGVWPFASELSAALLPHGVESVLALLGPAPSPSQRKALHKDVALIDTGLDLDWLARDAAAVEATGRAIAALAHREGADLVHLNQPALAAGARFTMPVVTTIHSCVATWWQATHDGDEPDDFAWQVDCVSRGLRRSNVVVAPSEAFAEAVQRRYALPDQPRVVPNGRRSFTASSAPVFDSAFTAGRLWDRGKNIATLDRVAAGLRHPLRAAGALRGPNGESIALRHIETLGALDEPGMARCLAARPIFVSAARYEPFGLAVLEAASAGCALVLADIATLRENWEGAACFVEPSDEAGFATAIDGLFSDREARERQGERARDRAALFTPARMAAGMAAIFAQALASRHETAGMVAA